MSVGRVSMVVCGLVMILLAGLLVGVTARSIGGDQFFVQAVIIALLLIGGGGWLIRRGLGRGRNRTR